MIAVYSRQSVDKKDSISIESQIEFCKKELNGPEEVKVYTDRGYSGKDTNRPAFEEMMGDVKSGLINKVVVYKLDRISRSTLDFANIIYVFKKNNVEFVSTTEKFDTSTPIGQAMLQIVMVFAELERRTIQQRIKDNYYARGRKGFYMGGRAPYGFTKIRTEVNGQKTYTFENDDEQLPHLIKMFELYANIDMSLGKISRYLNKKNIPAAEGGKWDSCKISRMLRNPVYVKADANIYQYYKNKGCIITNDIQDFIGTNGCYLYGKRSLNERKFTNVENHNVSLALHEGIIDSHTFLLCQYKLDDNRQLKNDGKGKHSWLSGYAKCGYCGYAATIIYSGSARRYRYFNCRGKTNLKICKGHSKPIYADEVEKIVEIHILEKVKELKNVEIQIENNNIDTNDLKLQILKIDKQIENLLNQIAESNEVVMKYINKKIASLDNTKNTILEEVKKIALENSKSQPINDIIERVEDWNNLSLENKKEICGYFINKVLIKDNEIEIDWKI